LKILVTFAVEPEFAPFRKLRDFEPSRIGELAVYSAQIGRAAVDVVVTGMGQENAARAVETALATSAQYTICICSGFCGGLKATVEVGDILAARTVRDGRTNKIFECSSGLAWNAVCDGAKNAPAFISSEEIAATVAEKARLAPFADAVDMESYAVLITAKKHKVPGVAIRVVSDRFDHDMPIDFSTTVDAAGNVRIGGVLKRVAMYPTQIPALIRLGRESKTAAQGLATFLEAYIKQLSFLTHGATPEGLLDLATSGRETRRN
jgi:adenosylhomocysteine nucleosidase